MQRKQTRSLTVRSAVYIETGEAVVRFATAALPKLLTENGI